MYKVQFKKGPFEAWITAGSYGSEQTALSVALTKKRQGAMLVRVLDKKGSVVYSG